VSGVLVTKKAEQCDIIATLLLREFTPSESYPRITIYTVSPLDIDVYANP